MDIVWIDLAQQKWDYRAILANYGYHIFHNLSRIVSCIPTFPEMECNMIQVIWTIITLTKIVISCFSHGKYDKYFPLMNKYLPSLNLLFGHRILFLYHPNLWQEWKIEMQVIQLSVILINDAIKEDLYSSFQMKWSCKYVYVSHWKFSFQHHRDSLSWFLVHQLRIRSLGD
jgi:hypothetical protein